MCFYGDKPHGLCETLSKWKARLNATLSCHKPCFVLGMLSLWNFTLHIPKNFKPWYLSLHLYILFPSLSNLAFTRSYIWIKLHVYFGHNKISVMNDLERCENLKIRSLPCRWTSLGSKTLSLLFRNKYKKSSKDTPAPNTFSTPKYNPP